VKTVSLCKTSIRRKFDIKFYKIEQDGTLDARAPGDIRIYNFKCNNLQQIQACTEERVSLFHPSFYAESYSAVNNSYQWRNPMIIVQSRYYLKGVRRACTVESQRESGVFDDKCAASGDGQPVVIPEAVYTGPHNRIVLSILN